MNTETQLNEAWHRAAKEIIDRWVAPDMYGQAMAMLELAMKAACGHRAAQPVSAGLTDDASELKRELANIRTKHEVACSTLEIVKEQRGTAQKALTAQCEETRRLRALLSAAQQSSQPVADTSADARDVARYRFLAGADVPHHSTRWSRWKLEYWDGYHGGWQPLVGTDLDEQIDAAIAASGEKK